MGGVGEGVGEGCECVGVVVDLKVCGWRVGV
jgi:hypothetical protein